jgi:hypothetical protein
MKAMAINRLFARFDAALTYQGYFAMGGQIISQSWCRPRNGGTPRKTRGPKPERNEKPANIQQSLMPAKL